jgi:uncharacterized protein (TIGR02611 family)
VLVALRHAWHDLGKAPPGRRFQQRFQRRRSAPRSALRKAVVLAAGVLVVIAGVIALPLPGPGLAIMALGALLIAEESRAAARALDWLELKLRRLFASARPRPRRRGIL